ncbi:MAG TPA: hypothetical protein VHB02_05970 [Acidimicrobiales bacterium]|nr:hypothetical protein [Acidimicrobiales bacterium]
MFIDRIGLVAHAQVQKFRGADIAEARRAGLAVATAADLHAAGIHPYDVVEAAHNLEVNGGITAMLTLLIGGGGTTYSHGNARLCVGDGNGSVPTVAATDTALAAPTNRWAQATDAGSPSVSGQTLTAVATFGTGVANFPWREWGIDAGGASGSGAATGLFNHRGVTLGAKSSASAWVFTATITQS